MSGTADDFLLSVIIPCFNEEQTIGHILERVERVKLRKEIIVVDDGSTDGTREVLERWKSHAQVKRVYNSLINLGKGAAIRFGLEFASGDVVIIQDADLELDPEEYHALLEPIRRGETRVVYGSRFLRRQAGPIPFKTRLANRMISTLATFLYGQRLSDVETAYKVFRRDAIAGLRLRSVDFAVEVELTAKLLRRGERIVEVPIRYNPRTAGEGKKIRFEDGLKALYGLVKHRFFWRPEDDLPRRLPTRADS